MFWPLFALLSATLVSALAVRAMISIGVLDVPGHRSSHSRPTPKGGGIGVMCGFFVGVPFLTHAFGFSLSSKDTLALMGGMLLLAAFSWLDDLRSLPARTKLLVQGAACVIALAGTLHSTPDIAALVSLGVAFIWMMFVTNALNFIDGINGLCAGTMILTGLAANMLLILAGPAAGGVAAAVLAFSLAGFLPFNFPRARIFMGDVGSQPAGLATAWFAVQAATHHAMPRLLPLMLAGVLFDVTFTLVRRRLAGQNLMEAHRGHLYQLSVRSGISATRVTLLYWGFALIGVAIGLGIRSWATAFVATLIPQIVWASFVVRRARRTVPLPW